MESINPLVIRIRRKILHQNLNVLVVIVGQTGAGKSWSGIGLAGRIDPTFYENIKDRVVFTVKQFKELLSSEKLKKGNAIVFDEIGISYGARHWQSYQNITMGEILQTMRYKNLCLIMTVPSLDFVDITARRLLHFYIECKSVNQEERLNIFRPFEAELQPRISKTYFKNIHYVGVDGITAILALIEQTSPPREVTDIYEAMAQEYKDSIIAKKLGHEEKTKDQYKNYIETIKISPDDYTSLIQGKIRFNSKLISAKFGISDSKAEKIKALVEKEMSPNAVEKIDESKPVVKRYSFT
jgi:hypothetical protein